MTRGLGGTRMRDYYVRNLAGERLRRCYELAPLRVRRYLAAEIEFVLGASDAWARVLELGCGYGRVLQHLATHVAFLVDINLSQESLALARRAGVRAHLARMHAMALALPDAAFDLVLCVQNGAAIVGGTRLRHLMAEALRVTRPGGRVLLSSCAAAFWDERLRWFRLQVAEGLVGEIDDDASRDGRIVCRDGFTSTTVTSAEFRAAAAALRHTARVTEVDGSSVFCEVRVS